MDRVEAFLATLADLPPLLLYTFIGLGAAIENVVPPIPADTFVLFGAFLAATGQASATTVFLVTWGANVASALTVYELARRHAGVLFETRIGRWLLHPKQLEQIGVFYSRWGTPAIFVSRFLPGLRAVVPVFAGVSHMGFFRVALPLAAASGLWYGFLVYLGAAAGRNWKAIVATVEEISDVLLWVAVPLLLLLLIWWWRTRHHPEEP